jgi:benzodiazapine receptor
MTPPSEPGLGRDIGFAALAVAAVAGALLLGQLATYPNLPWHAGLAKPSFNPPNWLFGPVWTALYVLMAFALWRILRISQPLSERRLALALFFVQLGLNVAWSWMFFAAHSPFLGMINIVPQWLAVVATAGALFRLDKVAAWCLVPLVAWIGFASVLNIAIWRLN